MIQSPFQINDLIAEIEQSKVDLQKQYFVSGEEFGDESLDVEELFVVIELLYCFERTSLLPIRQLFYVVCFGCIFGVFMRSICCIAFVVVVTRYVKIFDVK